MELLEGKQLAAASLCEPLSRREDDFAFATTAARTNEKAAHADHRDAEFS